MDVKMIEPILTAFTEILPQIGFQSVIRKDVSTVNSSFEYQGVLVIISIIGQIKGATLIEMTLDSAKKIASKMMMGMPVNDFDALAQSAISEMGNMVCANTCTQFSKSRIEGLDISPPTLLISEAGVATLPFSESYKLTLTADEIPISVYVCIV